MSPRSGPGQCDEARLRDMVDGLDVSPFTADERTWCVREAVHFAEGGLRESDLTSLDDATLAFEVLGAWWDYVRSNVL